MSKQEQQVPTHEEVRYDAYWITQGTSKAPDEYKDLDLNFTTN